jgi:phage gp29-like protein
MSSGASGEGSGASLQEKETDILRRDDAETIAETLAEVSRMVIEWHFGNGVAPLARVELVVPVAEDATQVVTAATLLADRGAKVSVSAMMDRLNLPKATDEADALSPAARTSNAEHQTSNAEVKKRSEELENSSPSMFDVERSMLDVRNALAADLQPLGDALFAAYQAGDFAAMQAALKKISAGMPALAGDAGELSATLAQQMTTAWLGDSY